MGAMENAGLRDLPRRVPPPLAPDPLLLRAARQHRAARDGPHVVRRPGHHALVGRPLAQRVLRRVGLPPRDDRGDEVHRRLDRLHQRPEELGLPPGPAALDAPDRGRQRRPRGGRGQLRRHHLRQGRLDAQAARRLGRDRGVHRRPAGLLQDPRVRELRVQRPARLPGEGVRARPRLLGRASGCRPPASTRSPRSSRSTPNGAFSSFAVAQTAAPEFPTLRRHRIAVGLYDVDGRPRGAAVPRSRSTSSAISPRCPTWSARSSRTWCCSTTATSPTPRSASTSARWRPRSTSSTSSTTPWPAPCCGARPGT